MSSTGRCLCGAVAFEAEGVSTEIHACHCGMCRRWSGGSGMGVEAKRVTFTGEDQLRRYDSSEWAERGFCTHCGTNLFYCLKSSDAGPGTYTLWLGAFDDQAPFALTQEIFVDEKPASFAFAGEHPRLTGDEFIASLNLPAPEGA